MNRGRINQGIILVLIGLFFLLRNMGWIDHTFVNTLVANWPILLIFAGVYTILSRTRLWFIPALLSIFLFLMLMGIVPVFFPSSTHHSSSLPFRYEIPADIEALQITLSAPAADVTIQRGTAELLSGNVNFSGTHQPEESGRRIGNLFIMDLHDQPPTRRWVFTDWKAPAWQVYVPATVPTSIEVDTAAGNITLDMRGLNAKDIDVATSAGNVHVLFDEAVIHASVTIETAASNVQISVPETVGLRIHSSGAIVANNLKSLGFEVKGNWHISPHYDQAERKVDVHVSSAVGKLHINRTRPTSSRHST